MSMAKKLQHEGRRISMSLKAVLLVAAVGIVASVFVAFEAPPLMLAPDEPVAMMATVVLHKDESPRMSAATEQAPAEAARADRQAASIASK
jgi:hypothetical protein